MARAITAPELAKLRADGQFSRLYLAFLSPSTVWKASVTAAPTVSNGSVYEVAVSNVSGTYSNVLADQTVMVTDSTEATIKGYCRVRKAPTSTLLYIGELADGEIDWAVNDRIHVLNDWQVWPKHIRIVNDTTFYEDWDIAYSDQHASPDPLVNMGPDAVAWLTGSSVAIAWDASGSTVVSGSIASYSWSATGPASVTITNGTTATPSMTFTQAGTYRIACTVTTTAGKSFTGYRWAFIFNDANPPTTEFVLNNCNGSVDAGGWSFGVTLLDQASLSEVKDRARVVLFARDWYQGTEESLGPITGRENVIASGWIVGETIEWNPDTGNVAFEVEGPQYWLNLSSAFPCGLEDTNFADNSGGDPSLWTQMSDLTADKAIWHLLHWRSTLTRVCDVYLPGSTLQAATIAAPDASPWAQLITMAESTILARPVFDRYGRLFVKIDQNFVAIADRASIPTVMTLATNDHEKFTLTRRILPEFAQVELSGVYYSNGSYMPIGARSPGNIPTRLGQTVQQISELVTGNQTATNELAGLFAGSGAGPIESADINLAENNRFVDIAPYQYLQVTITTSDTVREYAVTNAKLIPSSVDLAHNADTGGFTCTVECEGEGIQLGAVAMTFPGEGEPPVEEPTEPPTEPPAPPEEPPEEEPVGTGNAVVVTTSDVRTTTDLSDASPTWTSEL